MFDTVLDAFAEVTGCDRLGLAAFVGEVRESGELKPKSLVDRIAAKERLAQAVQATQAHDLAAFAEARLADDVAEQVPDHLQGRTAGVEVAAALNVASMTGTCRLFQASTAVQDHPELLARVGTGAVSMAGLGKAARATEVLGSDLRRLVDAQLAADADRARLTPGQLEKAALRRVLAVDPDGAAKRAAAARARRGVRLTDPVDGTACLFARLRAEEALAVFGRLDRTARGMRRDGDPRSIQDLMADLFVQSILGVPMVVPEQAGTRAATTGTRELAEPDPRCADQPLTWRSVDGCEPWLWSDPPPLLPDPDPDLDDPAWDRLCAEPPPRDPAGGERRDQDTGESSGGPAAADPGDHARGDPPDDPCGHTAHPAHAPPALSRRLPMRVEVQVVVSAATLLGLDEAPGMLRGYGAIPASVVRDIVDAAQDGGADGAARSTLRALLCDPTDGRLLTMEAKSRLFAGPLRQFALCRDQHCRLTGGPVADVDHIHEHRHGGQTTAGNGQSLGKLAHVLKDHPAVRVTALPPVEVGDGLDHLRVHAPDLEWRLPSGHSYRLAPPPALGPGSHPTPADQTDPQPASIGEQHFAALLAHSN